MTMGTMRTCRWAAVLAVVCAALGAQAQIFYQFGDGGTGDAAYPDAQGTIVQGRDGNLYGTTRQGGAFGGGAMFKITPQGKLTVIFSFNGFDGGEFPYGGLTLGTDGNFYGTTRNYTDTSGFGTVFRVPQSGSPVTQLHIFSLTDGGVPVAPPIQGTDGAFYGTTPIGGANNLGTLYRITSSGGFTLLYSFDGTNGANPYSSLVQGTDGNFYGTAILGGPAGTTCDPFGCGTIFKMTPQGKVTTLYAFTDGPDGGGPAAPLFQSTDGNFYGTTQVGGITSRWGTVFKITSQGKLTVLHTFSALDGQSPIAGVTLGSDGNLYGTASLGGYWGYGVVYRISPQGKYEVLYDFADLNGSTPTDTPLQHTTGLLFGDTSAGGDNGIGVFYGLDLGLEAFAVLVPSEAMVGKTVGILGQGFKGATAVSFNGTAASFVIKSSTFLEATVPTGVTTGRVTVTTSKGNLVSNRNFRVLH